MKRLLFMLLFCTLQLTYASAQGSDEKQPAKAAEMNVDMPDETEETSILEKGQWQFETALLYTKYKDGAHSLIGQGLVKYGVGERLELRLLLEEGHNRDRYIEETVQSTYPLSASAKVVLMEDHKWLPDMTLVGFIKLPFTSMTEEQSIYYSPILLLAFQNKIGDKWKLEYNAGIQQEAYGTEWVWLGNALLHYKLTDDLELFTEYYAQYQDEEDPIHNLGGGVAYQLGYHLEFYLAGGSTVNYSDPSYFVSGGVAVRTRR